MQEQILWALIAAIVYALSGYFKNAGDKFDKQKFFNTLMVGLVVGVLQVALGLTYDVAYSFVMAMGLVAFIENICKAIWRHLHKPKVRMITPLAK